MQKNGAGIHSAHSCYWDSVTDGICLALSCFLLSFSCLVLFSLAILSLALSCLVFSCLIFSCFVLSRPCLFLALSWPCLVLSYCIVICLVLSCCVVSYRVESCCVVSVLSFVLSFVLSCLILLHMSFLFLYYLLLTTLENSNTVSFLLVLYLLFLIGPLFHISHG